MKHFIFILLLSTSQFYAQIITEIDDVFEYTSMIHKVELVDDIEQQLTLNTLNSANFKVLTKKRQGVSKGAFWLRFSLKNTANTIKNLELTFTKTTFKQLELYQKKNGKIQELFKLGKSIADINRSRVNTLNLDISLEPNKPTTFYIKMECARTKHIPLSINTVKYRIKKEKVTSIAYGIYYGVVFIFAIINLILFFFFKEIYFLHYCGFVLSICLVTFNLDGNLYAYFGSYFPLKLIDQLIYLFVGYSTPLFVISFLNLKLNLPIIRKILYGIMIFITLAHIFFYVTENYLILKVSNYVGLTGFFLAYISAVMMYKKEINARFITSAYGVFLIFTIFTQIAVDNAIIQISFFIDLNKILSVIEIISMSVFMVYRFKNIEVEALKVKLNLSNELSRVKDLNKHKTETFVNLSHEIRNPIALLQAYQNQLEAPKEKINETNLTAIDNQITEIKNIVDHILEVSKSDDNQLILNKSTYSIQHLLNKVYGDFQYVFQEKEIHFKLVNTFHEYQLSFDFELMERAFKNIVNNAAKFTPKGGSVVVNTLLNEDDFVISIQDDGVGIAVEEQQNIFNRFYQVQTAQKTADKGSGVGLAYVKQILLAHDYSVKVESEPNKGANFLITIPNTYLLHKVDQPTVLNNTNAPKILVVDDHAQMRKYIKSILKNYEVVEAKNGQEALDVLQNNSIDLLLTDYMMPVMNGWELIQAVKKLNYKIPVFVLTSETDIKKKLEILRLGIDNYFMKPFYGEELIITVENALKYAKVLQTAQQKESNKNTVNITLFDDKQQKDEQQIKHTIATNIDNHNFGVTDVAKALNISAKTLNRKTKLYFGQTPNQLILETRLKQAKLIMVKNPNISLKELSSCVGFKNTTYLQKRFKERYKQESFV